jgi:N-methylhydantoinase A/oxoprolinase/acetone carboxylase beta subunit
VFGSTVATNALIERTLSPVAFLGTAGFTDTLEIRRVWRQHLFGWRWERPRSLVPHDLRFGIAGRIDWRGQEIEVISLGDVDAAVEIMRKRGVRVAAVSLLFSFLNPDHEHSVRSRIQSIAPDIEVVLSSTVNPEISDYERASTTVIAASLSPLMEHVLSTLEARLASHGISAKPQVIKSNGGIMSTSSARAKPLEMVRSGPAGGVASALRFARETGRSNLITVDIGGTTADVAVITGGHATYTQHATLEWDIPLRVGMADVRSIGAGGGSIASLDAAARLTVGPQSAGSKPGPVCYSRGGTRPTVTDAAIIAGHLDARHFLGGRMPIDAESARAALRRDIADPLGCTVEQAACGVLRLATVRMAQLIDEMTVQVGLDPRDYVLAGFGGAGALFVAGLVEETEAAAGVVPLYPAVWSALGGLFADIAHEYARSLPADLAELAPRKLDALCSTLTQLATIDLARDGVSLQDAEMRFLLDLRYEGQSHEISVELNGAPPYSRQHLDDARVRFDAQHQQMFAHQRSDACRLVTVRLSVRVGRQLRLPMPALPDGGLTVPESTSRVWFHGWDKAVAARVLERAQIPVGHRIEGPALIIEPQTHCVIPPGLRAEIGKHGEIIIERRG